MDLQYQILVFYYHDRLIFIKNRTKKNHIKFPRIIRSSTKIKNRFEDYELFILENKVTVKYFNL